MPWEQIGAEPLDAVVNVRLTSKEKARLRADAEAAGMTMSELVRAQYFRMPIAAKADRHALAEMRRVGGLLKHVHSSSGGAYSAETAAALTELRGVIRRLGASIGVQP